MFANTRTKPLSQNIKQDWKKEMQSSIKSKEWLSITISKTDMSFDKADAFKGFLIGVLSSVTAVILWDYYKQKKNTLEYGEQKVIDEVKSAINGLRDEVISRK